VGWEIDDLSVGGAFLETRGPLAVGRELELALLVDDSRFRVRARVVRVQEPSWEHVAGVGVTFLQFEEGDREALATLIDGYS
jgi:Tfp pilus assembly protein PilZ